MPVVLSEVNVDSARVRFSWAQGTPEAKRRKYSERRRTPFQDKPSPALSQAASDAPVFSRTRRSSSRLRPPWDQPSSLILSDQDQDTRFSRRTVADWAPGPAAWSRLSPQHQPRRSALPAVAATDACRRASPAASERYHATMRSQLVAGVGLAIILEAVCTWAPRKRPGRLPRRAQEARSGRRGEHLDAPSS